MPFAVEMYFDPATEAEIRALWNSLAQAGVSSRLPDSGSRPHISLAVFQSLDPARFRAELQAPSRANS